MNGLQNSGPLDGIRVIDLTHALAGPMCTYQLGLQGADIIKVESPKGDDFRPRPHGRFAAVNAGKRSIVLDLKTDEGKQALRKLISSADVVVENFRPGGAAQLGLDWQALHAENPRLITCSISGYGQEGPMSAAPAIEWSVQAVSGLSSIYLDDSSDEMELGVGMLDPFTGYVAFSAILAALLKRERTGKGERLDVSMLDASFVLASSSVTAALSGGPGSLGKRPQMARYRARDRRIFIAALTPAWMKKLCEIIGAPELATDERFATPAAVQKNARQFVEEVNARLVTRDAEEWERLLNAEGVPAGASREITEIAASEQVAVRKLVHEVDAEEGRIKVVGSSFPMEGSTRAPSRGVPRLGEHTDEILLEFGIKA